MAPGHRAAGVVRVRRFAPEDVAAIERLNSRLAAGGAPWTVWPEGAEQAAGPMRARLFVADDDAGEVRGASWIHEHEFRVNGEDCEAGWAKYLIAESLVDPAFAGVAAALMVKLTREQPRMLALGMGGMEGPFARLLASFRWHGEPVPFLVRILRPARVVTGLPSMRRTWWRAAAGRLAALTGAAWIGGGVANAWLARRAPSRAGLTVEIVPDFGGWADAIWERCRDHYTLIGRRDAAMLQQMYPSTMPVVRLRVCRSGQDVGWVVVLLRDLRGKRATAFGALQVGVVVDGLADPADVPHLVAVATDHLRRAGADLVFSNQASADWQAALRQSAYLEVPSTFAVFASPKLAGVFRDPALRRRVHLNRGDCDGPMFA